MPNTEGRYETGGKKMNMARLYLFMVAACIAVVVAGCAPAAPAASPSATLSAPTQAPATTAPANAAVAATAAPAKAAPTSAAAGVSASRWTLDPAGSEARFKAREQLAGRNLPNDAIGKTKAIRGAIVVDKQGAIVADQSKFEVDLRTLTSDQSRRDDFIKANTLNTGQYPAAVFVPTAVTGLPSPIPESGEGAFKLTGNMTVHGVTKPATWDVTVKKSGNQLTGTASTVIKLTDYGMTPPRVPVVLSIEENIPLELDFAMTLG
jgi:polyisoprenoid-binding protein YceI